MVNQIRNLRKHIQFIVLIGANGAGKSKKGEILELLTSQFGTYRIVMSDLIKKHRREKTPLGAQFDAEEQIESAGGLLSDNPVFEAFEQEVIRIFGLYEDSGYKGECTIILDGFPRNILQLKHFMSYRIPFTFFHFNIDEATCLYRVKIRAETEGSRGDDPVALDRFKLQTRNNADMMRMAKASNPHSVVPINGTLPVREQITRIIKRTFGPRYVMQMIKRLDNTTDSARKKMDEIEGKIQRGGATAHAVNVTTTAGKRFVESLETSMATQT